MKRKNRFPSLDHSVGFSLVELVFALSIMSVLASISWMSMSGFRQRAEAVGCMQHMKSIGIALNAYTQDHGYWPQFPIETATTDEEKTWEWWYTTLEPYQIHHGTWLCPTHERQLRGSGELASEGEDEYMSSYGPTLFEKNDSAPFVHGTPWLIERGNFHLRGQQILMPDGSIQSFRSGIE
ncbi:MAG: prepilin-type N-terminal cleavage/methylation domain-containing protein [Verrucomicrobiales bacterium]|jgi:prepilin-type N-terminal cleavage/methylation domain-containing protein